MINIGIISLGCAKNTVDSEKMLGVLKANGYNIVNDENNADVIIINTCAFIESAKRESIDYIIKMGKLKEKKLKVLIAAGCLSERYRNELLNELPELDAAIGTGDFLQIADVIKDTLNGKRVLKFGNYNTVTNGSFPRLVSTPKHYGYLKISEGCNNKCTFCIIPKLRGKYRSFKMEDLLNEAQMMVDNGAKEIILIAEDTTKYGIDLYKKLMLSELLKRLSEIDKLKWIRLLYAYPDSITEELIDEIRKNDKVVKYIDMPLQHSNDEILKNMKRNTRRKNIEDIIYKLKEIPGMIIRTTFIVGFPGETEEQFKDLIDFTKKMHFNKVGVFTYSREENTDAYDFPEQINEKTKNRRYEQLMEVQKNISLMNNQIYIGKNLEVVIEGFKNNYYIGRSYMDAPEIDGLVYIKSSRKLNQGEFVNVKVKKVFEYDLLGELI